MKPGNRASQLTLDVNVSCALQFARFFGMGKKKQKPDEDGKPPKGKKR